MNNKISYLTRLFAIPCTFLLTSCASMEQQIHNQLMEGTQAVIDAAKGYRIQYLSIPAGAKVLCNGEEKGVAPFPLYYELSSEQKSSQILLVEKCQALWPTGARVDIQAEIPLDQFPRFVNLTAERPRDAPDYEVDENAGAQLLASRQKEIDDIAAAANQLMSLGFSLIQLSKVTKSQPSPSMPSFNHSLRSASAHGSAIRWNWIQSPTTQVSPSLQPFQPLQGFTSFGADGRSANKALVRVHPASSCQGAILMGQCHGSIIGTEVMYCAGSFIKGECLGSVIGN